MWEDRPHRKGILILFRYKGEIYGDAKEKEKYDDEKKEVIHVNVVKEK